MSTLIVMDTSVFVSALIGPSGASRAVLRGCLTRQFIPLMGEALFAEYESLISREGVFENCKLNRQEREALFNAFLSVCSWQKVYFRWRPNLRDEADNHIVELAIAGGSNVIVTKNIKDFKNSDLKFPYLHFLKPEELIEGELYGKVNH